MTFNQQSDEWKLVVKHFEERLERACRSLEAPMSEVDTARLRGKIAAYREILSLPASIGPAVTTDPLRFGE